MRFVAWLGGRTFASLRNHRNFRLYFFAFQGGAPLGGLLAGWLTSRGGTGLAFTATSSDAWVTTLTRSRRRHKFDI